MTDCPNAEMRDRLPDLLHDRLDASERAVVMAHVADCADCRAELEVLRGVQRMLIEDTPAVDVARIVAALPKPAQRPVVAVAAGRRRTWVDWRMAAAITVLAVGAGSFSLLRHDAGHVDASSEVVAERSAAPAASVTPATPPSAQTSAATNSPKVADGSPGTSASPASPAHVAPSATQSEDVAIAEPVETGEGGRLVNLSQRQLKALIDDIDQMPATPLTEVEPASIKIEVRPTPPTPPGSGQ